MLKIRHKRWSNINISYQKVIVDDLSLTEEVINSINNKVKGIDIINNSKGLARYYLVTYIIN
jgi:NADP-dependent 3-hydroxy acid dehydrogenase YdfG